MSNEDNYWEKDFPYRIKDFYKYDLTYFNDILDNSSISVTKNMHPIIAYNYPELLTKFYNEKTLDHILKSPSILLYYNKHNLHTDKINEQEIKVCGVMKNIYDKKYTLAELMTVLNDHFDSKRQRAIFSKVYPELHDKFDTVYEYLLYNLTIIAIDQENYEFIIDNINFAKQNFKNELIKKWSGIFKYLDESEYTDDDVLNFIKDKDIVHYLKNKSSLIAYMTFHLTTENIVIDDKELFDCACLLNIDVKSISTDFLNANALKVIKQYPYFYSELDDENKANEEIKHHALVDPYNILEIGLSEENVRYFLNCSNNNISDSMLAISYMSSDEKKLLKDQIKKFTGMFFALETYPVLIDLLNDNEYSLYVTPYLINHACKIDEKLFEYFITKEKERWKSS